MEAGMAEDILPHPKSTDPNLDPRASSFTLPWVPGSVSSVSGEPSALSGSLVSDDWGSYQAEALSPLTVFFFSLRTAAC